MLFKAPSEENDYVPQAPHNNLPQIQDNEFSEKIVEEILQRLPKYKSPGPDLIPGDILRSSSKILASPITKFMIFD